MKKALLGFMILLAGLANADPSKRIRYVQAVNFMNGDAFTRPLATPLGTGGYFAAFKNNTVLSLSPTTGLTFTATIQVPTDVRSGSYAVIGFTGMYEAVTDSANISATAKVQSTTYSDSQGLTNTTLTVSDPYIMASTSFYGRPTDADLMRVAVNPGDIILVQITRALGAFAVIDIYRVYGRFEPTNGWPGGD